MHKSVLRVTSYDALDPLVTPDHVLLLDVDYTVLAVELDLTKERVCGRVPVTEVDPVLANKGLPTLHKLMQRAQHVMFVTARNNNPETNTGWHVLNKQLDAIGVSCSKDHAVFTSKIQKGAAIHRMLHRRGLQHCPVLFVDDNVVALFDVKRAVPHVQCALISLVFDRETVAQNTATTVLRDLPSEVELPAEGDELFWALGFDWHAE